MEKRMDFIPKKGFKIANKYQIFFGMLKKDVIQILGEPKKINTSQLIYPNNIIKYRERFYYDEIWLAIDFLDDKVESFETGKDENIIFNGINLSKNDFKKTINELQSMGYHFIKDDDIYKFNDLNFFIYAPRYGDDEETREVESVGVYVDGYFEKMKKEIEDFNITSKIENGVNKVILTRK